MLELSSICNAKCIFCPYTTMKRSKKIMSDETFNKIIERIKDEKIIPEKFELFLIGEPFIDKNIFKRIDRLHQEFPNALIEITSNFGMVNKDIMVNLLNSPVNFINISVNAANADTYKNLMGLDYNVTVNNIKTLLELKKQIKSNLKIQLSFVISKENKKEVMKFMLQWINKPISLRFQQAAEWLGTIPLKEERKLNKKLLYPCLEIFTRLPILSNGDYSLCCQDAEGLIKMNIADTKILDAFHSKVFEGMRKFHLNKDIRDLKMCRNCLCVNANGAGWIFTSREV